MLFLLLREATFLPTADKRNDKKCNFASENLITELSQMGKLKNLKKLEKLKPYALQLNIQPKRLLAITSNDRREW